MKNEELSIQGVYICSTLLPMLLSERVYIGVYTDMLLSMR